MTTSDIPVPTFLDSTPHATDFATSQLPSQPAFLPNLDQFKPAPQTDHISSPVYLPVFIRPVPPTFDNADLEFLRAKGAFEIPDVPLRTELIKAYIQYVHPFMPLLSLEEFLSTTSQDTPYRQLSLLLFQAVMFAGTAFVPQEFLFMAGFDSRKATRKLFFERVRVSPSRHTLKGFVVQGRG